jgi:N-acetylglucosaminyldiphosphoundecaprenol N-acetyl-beta-D-mannosaminyltransferase
MINRRKHKVPDMASNSVSILGSRIDAVSWEQAVARIVRWAMAREARIVCLCNVHSVISARRDRALRAAIDSADLATPDGAPLAWLMRKRGYAEQQRISGPDLMWQVLAEAERLQLPVFMLGSTAATLTQLEAAVQRAYPQLPLAGLLAPPFHALTAAENDAIIKTINDSGAQLLMVGLGCPKQEIWMASHRERLHAVMLGVGAAFDYHAGILKRAPPFWQQHGLEWLYRLAMEPSRLLKRYLVTNTLFLLALPAELWRRPRN